MKAVVLLLPIVTASFAFGVDLGRFAECARILADTGEDVDSPTHLSVAVDSLEERALEQHEKGWADFVRAQLRAETATAAEVWQCRAEAVSLWRQWRERWFDALPRPLQDEFRYVAQVHHRRLFAIGLAVAPRGQLLPYEGFRRGQLEEIPVRVSTLTDPGRRNEFLLAIDRPNGLIHPRRLILRPIEWDSDIFVQLRLTWIWRRLYGIHLEMSEMRGGPWPFAPFTAEMLLLESAAHLRALRFTNGSTAAGTFFYPETLQALLSTDKLPALRELTVPR